MEMNVEDGGKLLDKSQGYITFQFGSGQELFVSQLDDGRLNLRELFLTGADEPDRISPTVRGEIDEQPALYDVQEIRGIASGDFMDWQERREPLEHVLFSRIVSEDPYLLDFKHAYSFNCKAQEFYRIQYEVLGDAEECEDVVLRFQAPENRFLLQAEREVPSADTLYQKWDSQEAGLPHEHLDHPPPPQAPGTTRQAERSTPLHPAITVVSTEAFEDGTAPPEVEKEPAAMESGSGSVGMDADGGGVGMSEEALMGLPEDDDAEDLSDATSVDLA